MNQVSCGQVNAYKVSSKNLDDLILILAPVKSSLLLA